MIANGKKVSIHYHLTVDGQTVDKSQENNPLKYVHGSGQIIPGLEKGVEGLNVGDKKTVVVPSGEGYGARNPQAIVDIPKEKFGGSDIKVGGAVASQSPDCP